MDPPCPAAALGFRSLPLGWVSVNSSSSWLLDELTGHCQLIFMNFGGAVFARQDVIPKMYTWNPPALTYPKVLLLQELKTEKTNVPCVSAMGSPSPSPSSSILSALLWVGQKP